ncbi:hypothetical protein ACFL1F_00225 [Chlamydiota bacterium]
MPPYSILDYNKNREKFFDFLIKDYNFNIIEDVERTFSFLTIYEKNNIRIRLEYDFRDNFFYFKLIRGKDTKYPNDHDKTNIITFLDLFAEMEPGIDLKQFEPDNHQYLKSLELNAVYLKKYGNKILKPVN